MFTEHLLTLWDPVLFRLLRVTRVPKFYFRQMAVTSAWWFFFLALLLVTHLQIKINYWRRNSSSSTFECWIPKPCKAWRGHFWVFFQWFLAISANQLLQELYFGHSGPPVTRYRRINRNSTLYTVHSTNQKYAGDQEKRACQTCTNNGWLPWPNIANIIL